jgi:AraC-like DNA-binding protein
MDKSTTSGSGVPPLPEVLAVGEDRAVKSGQERGGPCGSDILSVYLRGGARYELGGVMFEAVPPFAILIPSGTIDRDLQVGQVEGTFALFRGHGIVGLARRGFAAVKAWPGAEPCVVPFLRTVSASEAIRLQDCLRRIGGITGLDQPGFARRAGLLLQAVSEYCGSSGDRRGDAVHREAQRLRDLIHSHAFESTGMTRMYRELGVRPAHAATLFSRAFGVSPVAYRMQVRLDRARELLMSTRRNVSQVAYEVGFTDPLYFSRVFRSHFGATPSSLIREFAFTRR